MGKHKPDYSLHRLMGDYVIVVNAGKVEVTGNPSALKTYYRHTGYVGHLRSKPQAELLVERPDRVIEKAVKGMLPGTRLGRQMFRRLKVYRGDSHPHEAQVNEGTGARVAARSASQTAAASPTKRRPTYGHREEAIAAHATAEALVEQAQIAADPVAEEVPAVAQKAASVAKRRTPKQKTASATTDVPKKPRAPRKKAES